METKEREKLITDAVAEFEVGLRSKTEQFEVTHTERKLNISVIETLWGETRQAVSKLKNRNATAIYSGITPHNKANNTIYVKDNEF
jgi:hypothetical protein